MHVEITRRGDEIGQGVLNAVARGKVPALEPFYYLKNFESVLSTILGRYPDLVSDEESGFISAFHEAPLGARALLARMVMRQGDLFRLSKLNYPEIRRLSIAAE